VRAFVLPFSIVISTALTGCGNIGAPIDSGRGTIVGGLLGSELGSPRLDGQWVIATEDGSRFCLTIQQQRVSILDVGCVDGGTEFVYIKEQPPAADAGRVIVLTVVYDQRVDDRFLRQRLTFSGEFLTFTGSFEGSLQIDVIGFAHGEVITTDEDFPEELLVQFALLTGA